MSASPPADEPRLVVVVKGYPRVSETFIARELAGLEARGFRLSVASLRLPYDAITHPVHREIRARVLHLPEYLRDALWRVLVGHLRACRRAPRRYARAAAAWLHDLARDPTVNRVRRFGQAGVLAAELPPDTRQLHAHFLHTPASVTRYTALITGLPYSLAGHAKDVWTLPEWELREKLAGARFCVTCTAANRDYLARLAPPGRVHLVYHGLDRGLFAPPATVGSSRDGSDPRDPVRLLSVGRFQPKKGFDLLLRALALLTGEVRLTLVGYGPEESRLRALGRALGVESRLRWAGQLEHPAVRALYRESDLFVLASRVVPGGDRDGLPNVVVEALSQGLPVVATRVAALSEIVVDGVNGRLVTPEDPMALGGVLADLTGDPRTRRHLGLGALRHLAEGWDAETGVDRVAALLGPSLRPGAVPAAITEPRAARHPLSRP